MKVSKSYSWQTIVTKNKILWKFVYLYLLSDTIFSYLGLENGYNIPEVMSMPSLKKYFNADAAVISELSRDMKRTDDVTRVFEDASLCFYRRKDSY